jgi:hypothetical protein
MIYREAVWIEQTSRTANSKRNMTIMVGRASRTTVRAA